MAANVFSTQLQKLRKAKGVKQEQLAEYLGVSIQAVSKWENGSYPDGDLLPRIAKYFEVSIDYLYGDEQEKMTMEDRVKEYLKEGNLSEKMLELIWMLGWGGMKNVRQLPVPEMPKDADHTATCILEDSWYYYMHFNEDMRYATVIETPKEGYEAYFAETDKLAEVCRFFGDEDNIKLVMFMLSLKQDMCVRSETVAEYLGISREKAAEALHTVKSFSNNNTMVEVTGLLTADGGNEAIYSTCAYQGLPYLRLLMAVKEILYPVSSWYGLLCNMENPLIDWEKFKKAQEKQKRNRKEEQNQ